MEHNDRTAPARLAGLGRKLAGAGFLVPSIALGATVALSVSQYVPTTYAAKATPVSQAGAAELKQVDTSQVEKQSGEPTSGVSLNASDYGIDAANLKDGVYTGSGTGFSGTITVQVTVAGGKITAIQIVSSGDDAAYLNRAQAVIPSVIAAQSTSVDTVSGATYSSKGILMAIHNALVQATGGLAQAVAPATNSTGSSSKPHTTINAVTPANGYADGVYLGEGEGYEGPMTVRVTVFGGKVTSIELVSSMDDEPYFGRAWATVPGRIIAAQTTSVDAVSGATYSSEGIRDAVNNALKKAAEAAGTTPEPEPEPTPKPDPTPDPSPTPDPDVSTPYEDGDYTAYALCQNEKDEEAFTPYYVALTVHIENGTPTGITDVYGSSSGESDDPTLDPFDEANDTYLDYAAYGRTLRGTLYTGVISQLIEGKKQPSQVDVVSRSTYSSRAIAKAYACALEKAHAAYEKAHGTDGDNGNDSDGATSSGTGADVTADATASSKDGTASTEVNAHA